MSIQEAVPPSPRLEEEEQPEAYLCSLSALAGLGGGECVYARMTACRMCVSLTPSS